MATNDDAVEQFLLRCEPEFSSSAERHRRLRGKLVKFFQWKRCEDPESLADETIGRIVAKIYEGEQIGNPSGYARGVALNVYREHVREIRKLAPLRVDWEVAREECATSGDDDAYAECVTYCSGKLSNDKMLVLEQYYSDEGSREELAARMGQTLTALRTKIHRIKAELKECYEKCISESSPDSERN